MLKRKMQIVVGLLFIFFGLRVFGLTVKTTPVVQKIASFYSNELSLPTDKNLTFSVSPQGLSYSQNFPVIIPLPNLGGHETEKNLMYIDPNATVEDMQDTKSLALLNNVNLVIVQNNLLQTFPLKDFPSITLYYTDFMDYKHAFYALSQNPYAYVSVFWLLDSVFYVFVYRVLYLIIFAYGVKLVKKLPNLRSAFYLSIISAFVPAFIELGFLLFGFVSPLPFSFLIIHVITLQFLPKTTLFTKL